MDDSVNHQRGEWRKERGRLRDGGMEGGREGGRQKVRGTRSETRLGDTSAGGWGGNGEDVLRRTERWHRPKAEHMLRAMSTRIHIWTWTNILSCGPF